MIIGGEGGMVIINFKEFWSKMWSYKDYGKSFDVIYNCEYLLGFRWLYESFGINWCMIEM